MHIMYFSSKNKHEKIKVVNEKLFLSPLIGISSIFIVDRKKIVFDMMTEKLGKEPTRYSGNIFYKEWNEPYSKLKKPLDYVHIYHNYKNLNETEYGKSTGYIHTLDVSDVLNDLEVFVTNDAKREVYYTGNKEFVPISIMKHTIYWDISYKSGNGVGVFK